MLRNKDAAKTMSEEVMSVADITLSPALISVDGQVGRITLNRPQALHALTHDMCELMFDALLTWAHDHRIKAVMIDHAKDSRGFCAGGDIRMIAQSGRTDGIAGRAFFHEEYRLNTLIKRYTKPVISFMDGVTMGGGVGISIHGSHRIATENTLFAMPETAIGLFPDVGGTWFLPRLEGELGMWLALTGARLKGMDTLSAGIATHFVQSDALETLKSQITQADLSENATHAIDTALKPLETPEARGSFMEHWEVMNRCFGKGSMSDVFIALKMDDSDWSLRQGEALMTRSPLSLCATYKALRQGALCANFDEAMRMEYRIASRIIATHDFSEGVRAVIEDKDHTPRWNPQTIGCVNPLMVDALFAPLDRELDLSF